VVIPANLKIGYESTVLSRGEACENTRKTRLSIQTERYLVDVTNSTVVQVCTIRLYHNIIMVIR
jgi:hypothetical protein